MAASARPEGDGIDVLVPQAAGAPEQALAAAGVTSDYPLFPAVGEAPTAPDAPLISTRCPRWSFP